MEGLCLCAAMERILPQRVVIKTADALLCLLHLKVAPSLEEITQLTLQHTSPIALPNDTLIATLTSMLVMISRIARMSTYRISMGFQPQIRFEHDILVDLMVQVVKVHGF